LQQTTGGKRDRLLKCTFSFVQLGRDQFEQQSLHLILVRLTTQAHFGQTPRRLSASTHGLGQFSLH
jgi:hypothetical protein